MKMRTRRCIKWQLDYVIFPPIPLDAPFRSPFVCVFFLLPFLIDVFKCVWPFIDFVKRSLPLLLLLSTPKSSFLLLLSVISSLFSPSHSSNSHPPACSISFSFIWSSNFLRSIFLAPYTHSLFHPTFQHKQTHTHSHSLAFATKLQLKLLIGCIYANRSNINLCMNKHRPTNTHTHTHAQIESKTLWKFMFGCTWW